MATVISLPSLCLFFFLQARIGSGGAGTGGHSEGAELADEGALGGPFWDSEYAEKLSGTSWDSGDEGELDGTSRDEETMEDWTGPAEKNETQEGWMGPAELKEN